MFDKKFTFNPKLGVKILIEYKRNDLEENDEEEKEPIDI